MVLMDNMAENNTANMTAWWDPDRVKNSIRSFANETAWWDPDRVKNSIRSFANETGHETGWWDFDKIEENVDSFFANLDTSDWIDPKYLKIIGIVLAVLVIIIVGGVILVLASKLLFALVQLIFQLLVLILRIVTWPFVCIYDGCLSCLGCTSKGVRYASRASASQSCFDRNTWLPGKSIFSSMQSRGARGGY